MKAVVLDKSCHACDMKIKDIPIPQVKKEWVLIKVKAFGLNHSEILLRQFEIDENHIQKPIIPGIECVGEIVNESNSKFHKGDKVIALMGGMGRSFHGSYSEYALLPSKQVFHVKTQLSWEKLAAIPETFFTAYGSLFESMDIHKHETILIRGATSALGIAAIQIAKANQCYVIATLRHMDKQEFLYHCGADEVILDDEVKHMKRKVDKVLELIGPRTLKESMRVVKKHGIVCHTGVLGGQYVLNHFDPIKDIPNGIYLSSFYSNYPTQDMIDQMFDFIETNQIDPIIGKVYNFEDIALAHHNMEEHLVTGKSIIIVR